MPFDRAPDPRRIDLRATMRDPLALLHVRQFQQRTAARVEILLDSSNSMQFGLERANFTIARDLALAVVQAAYEIQDSIGVAVCAESVVWQYAARRGDPRVLGAALAWLRPKGRSARGLLEQARTLTGRRRLVFLISDFAFPLEDLSALFEALASHDVVPIQVKQNAARSLPSWGIMELVELESRRRRMVLLRPDLSARWRRETYEREARVTRLCLAHGRRAYALSDRFDSTDFAEYLLNP